MIFDKDKAKITSLKTKLVKTMNIIDLRDIKVFLKIEIYKTE